MTDPRHEHAPRLVATTADDIETFEQVEMIVQNGPT